MAEGARTGEVEIHAATPDRWEAVATLAGNGFQSGCWCQFWRNTNAEAAAQAEGDARAALEQLVTTGRRPGLLAYVGGVPAAWVGVAPRGELHRLPRTKKLQSIDDRESMVVTCFFVAKEFRRQGITERLLEAAVDFARSQGADLVEAFPIDTALGQTSTSRMYGGALATFERCGFVEVVRRDGRPTVRREI